jgi:thiol-disulfide isomerase/thioredoxin
VGSSNLVAYGVATPQPGASQAVHAEWVKKIKARIAALGIHIPVLEDDGFRIGRLLGVRSVPSLSVLDATGRLRMANAGSLKQELEYKLDVAGALRRLASTGRVGNYGAMPNYYPATELVGKICPEFEAPLLGGGATRKSSSLLAADRVNVLIFWSEDCPHCRKSLPQISAYVKSHPNGINVFTAAKVQSDAALAETEDFCKREGLAFPTLLDRDLKVGQLFQVTSTPTIFIIRPDGVIDSVLFSGEMDYTATFDAKRKQLLKS